jgi:hypothetical protein
MKKKIIIPLVIVAVLSVFVAVGWFTYRTVLAAAPTARGFRSAISLPGNIQAMNYTWGAKNGSSDQGLADALSIPLATLQAAEKTATDEALKQAVAAGLITQSQADNYTANGKVFREYGENSWLTANGIDYNALLAKALNIDGSQLTAAYQTAYNASIEAAVNAGSLTQQQADLLKGQFALSNSANFQNAMQSAFTAGVNQAVKDGLITQAQADQIQSSNKNGMGFGFGHGRGPGGMGKDFGVPGGFFGGRHTRGGGNAPANPAAPTQTPSGGL